MTVPPPLKLAPLAALALLCALSSCGLYQPLSKEDREAVADCNQDVDRQFAAQNRYLLSERDGSASPFSGNTLAVNPNAGLADQYQQDQMVDKCLARSAAGPGVVPGSKQTQPAHP